MRIQEEMKAKRHSKYATHFAIRLFLLGQGNTVLLAYANAYGWNYGCKINLRNLCIQTNAE